MRPHKTIKKLFLYLVNFVVYQKQYLAFRRSHGQRFSVTRKDKTPCLNDKQTSTGIDKHYTYHTAWAARKLKELSPVEHVDISSYTYFATLVSAFIPMRFYDYRPAKIELGNLVSEHADITALPFETGQLKSVSCMHVVEHIGLGRYGDPLDVDGDLKAINELKRVVAKDGYLLFVVPIGANSRVMFNAHRIYSYTQVLSYFQGFELAEFSLIPDKSEEGLIFNASKEQADMQKYGCGCFLFCKE